MNKLNRNLDSIEWSPKNEHHEVNIASVADNQPSESLPMNLPRRDLLDRREDFNTFCVPLYNALTTNDFEAAKVIIEHHPELVQFSITENYETTLHIAVLGKSHMFVQYLMSLMTKEDLELPNGNGETTLCLVARGGNVEIAKVLMEKNNRLIDIPNIQGRMPLQVAALFGRRDMVEYLFNRSREMTGELWTDQNRSWVLEKCVETDMFDLALQMVTKFPQLAINVRILRSLAQKPYAFHATSPPMIHRIVSSLFAVFHLKVKFSHKEGDALKLLRIIWMEIMKLSKGEIDDIVRGPPDETNGDEKQTPLVKETQEILHLLRTISENNIKKHSKGLDTDASQNYSSHVLFLAAEMGNTTFLVEVIRQYPHLALEVNANNQSVFHVVVSHRDEGIFKLLYENDHIRDLIITLEDTNGNNMLHLVGESAKGNRLPNISGMGLRSNLELKWFKEVENMIPRHLQGKKNAAGLTPYELFIKNHNDLFSQEEKLMKKIATELMVVAALVATISFAALFTFPGGYDQNTGQLMFVERWFGKFFIIFDSLSLLSSTTSILLLLSIFMSDHDAYDYMLSSPEQVTICLGLVFFSIATVIITFLISLFLLCDGNLIWMPATITTLAVMLNMAYYLIQKGLLSRFHKLSSSFRTSSFPLGNSV